jgi:excisionase family DNA binding protein
MMDTNREIYLTFEEVAEHIKLSIATIRRYVMNREIPHYKMKKDIRFKLSEIEKWMEKRSVPVRGEKPAPVEGDLFSAIGDLLIGETKVPAAADIGQEEEK